MQIRSALRLVAGTRPATDPSPVPRTEMERAQYFASAPGTAAVAAWTAGFTEPDADCPGALAQEETSARLSVDAVLRSLAEQSVHPVALDLTHRLPAELVRLGWHAVKVVPTGLQPLRIDESCPFNWHRERIGTADVRTGLKSSAASGFNAPHPLI
jgi:ribosomal protein S12 methylthiotransferase accessory factor